MPREKNSAAAEAIYFFIKKRGEINYYFHYREHNTPACIGIVYSKTSFFLAFIFLLSITNIALYIHTWYIMPKFEKKMNKLLVGAILGTTLLWVAWATSLMGKVKDFIKGWLDELKKSTKKDDIKESNWNNDDTAWV
jgi:hypothetical protein